MNRKKRCAGEQCQELFFPRPQQKKQEYCSNPGCQQERRNKWQKEMRWLDKDYRANDAAARRDWSKKNQSYSRAYRDRNPEYVKRNREKQRERNKKRSVKVPEGETAAVAPRPETDLPTIELAGKTYMVTEITEWRAARVSKGSPLEGYGRSMLGKETDCKRGRVNRLRC